MDAEEKAYLDEIARLRAAIATLKRERAEAAERNRASMAKKEAVASGLRAEMARMEAKRRRLEAEGRRLGKGRPRNI